MPRPTEEVRRTYYLWACAAGLLTTVTLTVQAALSDHPERLYFLLTQPLMALLSAAGLAVILLRLNALTLLEYLALVTVTFATTARLPFDLLVLGTVPAGAEVQMVIGLLMSAVLGFLTLGNRSAVTFVTVLFAIHAGLLTWHASTAGPWLTTLGTQFSLGTLLLLLAALFHFRIGYVQASQDRTALHALTLTDPLTGLLNRRGGELALDNLTERGGGYLLAIADVDNFKQLNDRYGHAEGDRALLELAASLKHLRTAARWGGEEFLLLIGPPHDQAEQELRALLERTTGQLRHFTPVPVTLSVGAVWVKAHQPWQEALITADEALYTAKTTGKNRLVMTAFPPGGPTNSPGSAHL